MGLIDKLLLLVKALFIATVAVTAALLMVWITWFLLWMIGQSGMPPGS